MTKEQLEKDVAFLAERQLKAGSISFRGDRETGMSSNSIVAIVYGIHSSDSQVMPSDTSDLRACEIAYSKIPGHRKNAETYNLIQKAREAVNAKR